jgi:uncharacterized membrane protein
MSKRFKTSLLFYIPLGVVLSLINYKARPENISGSIFFGLIGAACVFFVPFLLKKLLNKRSRE